MAFEDQQQRYKTCMTDLKGQLTKMTHLLSNAEQRLTESSEQIEQLEKEIKEFKDSEDKDSDEYKKKIELLEKQLDEAKKEYEKRKDFKQRTENDCLNIELGTEYIKQHHQQVLTRNVETYLRAPVNETKEKVEEPPTEETKENVEEPPTVETKESVEESSTEETKPDRNGQLKKLREKILLKQQRRRRQ